MTVTSMPQTILPERAEEPPAEDVILGVDTHKDVHVAAVITVLGALLAHQEFPATAAGYRQLPAWPAPSASCIVREWSAPVPTELSWHGS